MVKGALKDATFMYKKDATETKQFDCKDIGDGLEQCVFIAGDIGDWEKKGFKSAKQNRQAIKFSSTDGVKDAKMASYEAEEAHDENWPRITNANCSFGAKINCKDQNNHKIRCTKNYWGSVNCIDHQGHNIDWLSNWVSSQVS